MKTQNKQRNRVVAGVHFRREHSDNQSQYMATTFQSHILFAETASIEAFSKLVLSHRRAS